MAGRLAGLIDRFFARYLLRQACVPSPEEMGVVIHSLRGLPLDDQRRFYAIPAEAAPIRPPFERLIGHQRIRFHTPLPTWCRENNTVHAVVHRRGDTFARPTMVLLHGWQEYSLLYTRIMAWLLARASMNTVILELPYHYHRRPPGSFNGEHMLSGDLVRTVQAFRQAVVEAQCVARWVKEGGDGMVGIFGTSIGGMVAALAATATDEVDFVVLNVPALDLVGALELSDLWEDVRERFLCAIGSAEAEVRDLLRAITPARHPLQMPVERVLILEAVYDRFVPHAMVDELWERWGHPRRVRFAQGHIGHCLFDLFETARVVVSFVRKLG